MFTTLKFKMKHIDKKFIFDSNLMVNKVSCAIYKDFLLTALTQDKYIAVSELHVVRKGLEHLQKAMNMNKKSVFTKKIVVSL